MQSGSTSRGRGHRSLQSSNAPAPTAKFRKNKRLLLRNSPLGLRILLERDIPQFQKLSSECICETQVVGTLETVRNRIFSPVGFRKSARSLASNLDETPFDDGNADIPYRERFAQPDLFSSSSSECVCLSHTISPSVYRELHIPLPIQRGCFHLLHEEQIQHRKTVQYLDVDKWKTSQLHFQTNHYQVGLDNWPIVWNRQMFLS
mmetsp:Transcript_5233/g.9142  ORF Transcript_5233/g.9142 Transcript_5233/m.9142 type:complete len:204 (-) Transcript_5233:803-1414(-)